MDISTEVAAIQAASEGSELRQPLVGALNKLNSGTLPSVTAQDAGKILKVGANGWEIGEKSGYMPVPSATKQINANGTYDVTDYSSAVVNISGGGGSILIPKTITQNGTYNPSDDNADGYSEVIVNVQGSGAGAFELLEYIESDGTQAIDLGVKTYYNTQMLVRVQALSGNTDYKWVLSSWYDSTHYAGIIYAAGVTRSYNGAGGSSIIYNGIDTANINLYSVIVSNSSSSGSMHNAQLFAIKDGSGTYINFSKIRLFFAIIEDDNVFIPVRRKVDNVCGVYNIKNGDFLTDSAGGNAFIAGPVRF